MYEVTVYDKDWDDTVFTEVADAIVNEDGSLAIMDQVGSKTRIRSMYAPGAWVRFDVEDE